MNEYELGREGGELTIIRLRRSFEVGVTVMGDSSYLGDCGWYVCHIN